mmetsp:Transcript_83824/g.167871  ORF Transcript_83824/g.167871 Transcript_83824/m.167871 type:complete len:282 (+) Transcript_83824:403-1248(+)
MVDELLFETVEELGAFFEAKGAGGIFKWRSASAGNEAGIGWPSRNGRKEKITSTESARSPPPSSVPASVPSALSPSSGCTGSLMLLLASHQRVVRSQRMRQSEETPPRSFCSSLCLFRLTCDQAANPPPLSPALDMAPSSPCPSDPGALPSSSSPDEIFPPSEEELPEPWSFEEGRSPSEEVLDADTFSAVIDDDLVLKVSRELTTPTEVSSPDEVDMASFAQVPVDELFPGRVAGAVVPEEVDPRADSGRHSVPSLALSSLLPSSWLLLWSPDLTWSACW